MALQWKQDHLGERYACAELDLGHDDEGPVNATLVSYKAGIQSVPETGSVPTVGPGEVPARLNAVLYIHGWSDYFFQRELAEFFAGLGIAFYALDLRKCGRSYRSWQTPGYVTSLSDYDADIDTALEALTSQLRNDHGEDAEINTFLMAHSTGALIASLWARRFPGRISALVLNSPWLDVQGSSIIRNTTQGLLEPITRFRPKARLKLPEFGFYWRSISNEADGEWQLHPEWRPQFGYPIRAGWLTAILAGHAQVRKGLDIPVPILVLASSRSTISPA